MNTLDGTRSIIIYESSSFSKYLLDDCNTINRDISAEYPIAFRPKRNSPRIISQKGMFTIHGTKKIPLNKLNMCEDLIYEDVILEKIIINKECKLSIFKELYFSGITESVLFPEITGLCNELSFRYSNLF